MITQSQQVGSQTVLAGVNQSVIDLTLNHPCKYFMVLYRTQTNTTNKEYFNFSGGETGEYAGEAFNRMSLTLNNNERLERWPPIYYRIWQPLMVWKRKPDKHIYVYSFALYPTDENPSGSLNFSRIDNAKLRLEYSAPLADQAEIQISSNIYRQDHLNTDRRRLLNIEINSLEG